MSEHYLTTRIDSIQKAIRDIVSEVSHVEYTYEIRPYAEVLRGYRFELRQMNLDGDIFLQNERRTTLYMIQASFIVTQERRTYLDSIGRGNSRFPRTRRN